jgi:glucokinase
VILAGDIGGTNTRLAYFAEENGQIVWKLHAKYPSKDYVCLENIIADFIDKYKIPVEYAAFGIAGVAIDGEVHATNLPWQVSTKGISAVLKAEHVYLLNDLEANMWGLLTLDAKDYAPLHKVDKHTEGNLALISAGTGLGEAGAIFRNGSFYTVASEGGHTDFAPRNEMQDNLLKYLRNQFVHVSWERLLSGKGLYNIYCFLRDTKYGDEPNWLTEELSQGDGGSVIAKNALANKSEACNEALNIFCEAYGAKAGNLALQFTAAGGVFLGGGIAPKIINKLQTSNFMHEFTDKGRMNDYLKTISVQVILNDNAALLGACKYAVMAAGLNKEIKNIN